LLTKTGGRREKELSTTQYNYFVRGMHNVS